MAGGSEWVAVADQMPDADRWCRVWLIDEDRPAIAEWSTALWKENARTGWWDERGYTLAFQVSHWAYVDAPMGLREEA